MNRVVLACDVNPSYAFTIPIACLAWSVRGYRPLLLLVGEPSEWLDVRHLRLAVHRAREVGAEIYWLGNFSGSRSSTAAQCSRIFAASAPGIADDDFLTTSDVDMLPVGPWVGGGVDEKKALHLWYSNAYAGSSYVHFPMCFVGAKAKVWREIAGCLAHGERAGGFRPIALVEALEECLQSAPQDNDGAWNHDERWLGNRIEKWALTSERLSIQEIPRTFVEGEWRIDRSTWMDDVGGMLGTLAGVADAHLPRPCFMADWDAAAPNRWSSVRPLFELLFSGEHMKWVDDYRAEWLGTTCRVYPPVVAAP